MNIAQTLLPGKQATIAKVSDRNDNSDLTVGTKNSFNDMFNNAASRAKKPSATGAGQIPDALRSDVSQPEGAVLSGEIPSSHPQKEDIFSEQQAGDTGALLSLKHNGADSSDSLQPNQELTADPTATLAGMLMGPPVNADWTACQETIVATVPPADKMSIVQKTEQIPSTVSMITPVELETSKTTEPHSDALANCLVKKSAEANMTSRANSTQIAPQSLAAKGELIFQAPNVAVAATVVSSQNAASDEPDLLQVLAPTVTDITQAKAQNQSFNDQGRQNTDTGHASQSPTAVQPSGNTLEVSNSQTFMQGLESVLTIKADPMLTTTAIEAQPANRPADVHQVIDQIVEKTRIISKLQNTEMIIKLKPEHLGELTLKVVIDKGAVNASFHSNNAEVRSLIEASLAQLKQELTNNGLKVENMSVSAGLSQFSPDHEHRRSFRQQVIKTNNKKNAGDAIAAIENQAVLQTAAWPDRLVGVDYRI